jgi:selenoprotein W-related protein
MYSELLSLESTGANAQNDALPKPCVRARALRVDRRKIGATIAMVFPTFVIPLLAFMMPSAPLLPSAGLVRTHTPSMDAVEVRTPRLSIEYCTRCNWMLRSAWMAQEILTTFNGTIAEVALVPNHEGTGTFECVLNAADGDDYMIWSRTEEDRFPESKELKQRVRDILAPTKSLGHSDSKDGPPGDEKNRGTGRTAVQRLLELLRGAGRGRGAQ